ncbi:hypothetical protein NFI96_003488 [Prochilodus magdalenae]|nr:hypothetical protein NFI96_003488 [Prochilodus magdalenae]
MMSAALQYLSIALLLTRASSIESLSVEGLSVNSASSTHHSGQLSSSQCTYTFILPENMEERGGCWPPWNEGEYEGNSVQRDAPLVKESPSYQRIQHLEVAIDNYTQRLQQIEGYAKDGLKEEMTQLQYIALPNHTVSMLDLSSNLLSQTVHYSKRLTDMEAQVYCNMETAGGGWTVIQLRKDGTLDFHRTWEEYKMGFGSLSGEHWLGNEFVFQLTSQQQYTLRVELTDWEGKEVFSQYDSFQLASEKHNYRLFLKSHSGTAGRQSSLVINGADFSTKDMDNDNCICKCALMLTGGWWFDACGPSNLNGMYYSYGKNTGKFNGIKWHYFKGSSYSLRTTTMMIRPADF